MIFDASRSLLSIAPKTGLEVYPRRAEFMTFGGAARHVLVNSGYTRIAVKIKCSDNGLYKVSPVYSFIDPGCSRDLEVSFLRYFAFHFQH